MLHTWMERDVLLYGMIGAGILGIFCMMMVNRFYNRIFKDLHRMDEPRGKWMKHFLEEYGQRKEKEQTMHNPEAFIRAQITNTKVSGFNIQRWKQGITLCSILCLGFLMSSVYVTYYYEWSQLRRFQYLLVGVGIFALLLFLKQSMEFMNKEDAIMDGLLDYMENVNLMPVPAASVRDSEERIREELIGRMTEGLAQNAATTTKFSHMLSPEEEDIMRRVIREYISSYAV